VRSNRRPLALPLLALTLAVTSLAPASRPDFTALYAEGVSVTADGQVVNVPVGAPASAALPLWDGVVPGDGTRWESMARRAMADLDVLTQDLGDGRKAAVAGWHRSWRYVWPRDASFVAAAYAVSGRHEDALAVLRFVQDVQEDDGRWHARYTADGAVPDDRGEQLDAVGWALWSVWMWRESARAQGLSDAEVEAGLRELRPMVVNAAQAAIDAIDKRHALPRPSQDFWEVPLRETSLGTAAPVLVGLRAATVLLPEMGESRLAATASAAGDLVSDGIAAQFGRRGYPRLVTTRQVDASVAFLMPPFTVAPPRQADAFALARTRLRTPHGGLRPGVEFKDRDISWTPQTALFALGAAASGDTATASQYLDWLDAHRTSVGSLPEKVDDQGRPAAVAPLAWSAALVLLTLGALEGDVPPPPGVGVQMR
jgi:GH15 family glucan-1,4-alpha-glucosidase